MKNIEQIKDNDRLTIKDIGIDGGYAITILPGQKRPVTIIFSWGNGWEHVSVSYPNRCCTWDEMCIIKDMFFEEDECVLQYHPPKSEYVNNHPYVLHLWKPQGEYIPRPPQYMV